MGPHGVIVAAPFFESGAGLGERGEQRLVQELVPEPAVEALDEGVLDRLAGIDVVPINACVRCPGQDRVAGQLGAVVAADRPGLAVDGDEKIEFAGTLLPDSEKSAVTARHCRVQTS